MRMGRHNEMNKFYLSVSVVVAAVVLSQIYYAKCAAISGGILQPKASEARELISLDGLWQFSMYSNTFTSNGSDLNLIPVPSSYNDISTSLNVRDHVGDVWYKRKFFVPLSWQDKKIWLRFGSVCYAATVEINGRNVGTHDIGHLPFQFDVTEHLQFGKENEITVIVNNILSNSTIPQGAVETLVSGRIRLNYTYDFFHYAGIDRPVVLYTTNAAVYVDDITIATKLQGEAGIVDYDISIEGLALGNTVNVTIIDKDGNAIASSKETFSTLTIPDVKPWWPYLMDPNPGYQYVLRVDVFDERDNLIDRYDQRFGVRELFWDNTTFKINNRNVYLRGFGRHEDSDIRGKGLDLPLIIRDYNLMRWIGANSYRTSHYPYAEEIMDLADELGIMIVDEVPAVNTENYNDQLLANHKRSITELTRRDKNRPSVVIWSVANEPRTQLAAAEDYYRQVVAHIKSIDTSRPVTIANMYTFNVEHSGQFLDILSFNRYIGWYNEPGELDAIVEKVVEEARGWHQTHNKPVLLTEYGADTLEGLHILPTYIWSEEFQEELMSQHFIAFDKLRDEGFFIGEMIWNFADFKTDQTYTRVGGNKKGIFTRNRQPKSSAHLLRRRYWSLARSLDNATAPADLNRYVSPAPAATTPKRSDEL